MYRNKIKQILFSDKNNLLEKLIATIPINLLYE